MIYHEDTKARREIQASLRVFVPSWLIPCLILLGGCQTLGPLSVRQGRTDYDAAIHDTSKDQVFLNMIRVEHRDTTLFMDVTEVDATLQFLTSLSGGGTVLGAGFANKNGGSVGNIS